MSLSSDIRAAFIETRDFIDPSKTIVLTGPNGLTARVVSSSFPESELLKEERYDAKIPSRVTILQEDFNRLAIGDRSAVKIYGLTLTVIVIDQDPADPLIDLTLAKFS